MTRVLIIEDEIDQAELYRMALEGAGHQVVGIADDLSERGLKSGAPPELVILDERLGRRSGSALIPRLRGAFPGIRILILTADPDVVERASELGADRARLKPLPLAQLVAEVKGLAR
jgi:DNA-binding response OmpR family regulator